VLDGGIPDPDASPSSVCGDGFLGPDEPCDGALFHRGSCQDFGFSFGPLACAEDCEVDVSACVGTEQCGDGRDNDGDGDVDCADSDCPCPSPCDSPIVADAPSIVSGNTVGLGVMGNASCAPGGTGPEQVFVVTPRISGQLMARVVRTPGFGVSIRSACAEPGTELGCADFEAFAAVTAGTPLYVIVEAFTPGASGAFSLELRILTP
jgi:hypothetical protein